MCSGKQARAYRGLAESGVGRSRITKFSSRLEVGAASDQALDEFADDYSSENHRADDVEFAEPAQFDIQATVH